jgi:plasmid stability protein
MPQLLVRKIEPAVVKELRVRAANQGISVEEAHRRLLREVLLGEKPEAGSDFLAYLCSVPKDSEITFERDRSLPREVIL